VHAIIIPPGDDLYLDMAQASKGNQSYFDGDAGEGSGDKGVRYGDNPLIMRYGDVDQDDEGLNTQSFADIEWQVKTAWMPFGTGVREERRVRRIWAHVRGDEGMTVALRPFINFRSADPDFTDPLKTELEVDGTVYAECMVPPDASAFQLQVEGDRSPAGVIGVGVDTEARRIRFGS
jgi:hypothetical protein